ncbi:MAG: hypothetical protein U1E62_10900 [Alsobacter sp.]
MDEVDQIWTKARSLFVDAVQEPDLNVARALFAAGKTWLLVLASVERSPVLAQDVMSVEQLADLLGMERQG